MCRQLSYCHMTVGQVVRFQLNFKSGKPVYLQLVDQVKAAAASGAVAGRRAAAVDPAARRGAARQPQHRRQGLRRARKPARHRNHRRQGLLRPRRPARRSGRTSASSCSPRTIDDAVVQAHHLQIARAEFLRLAEDRFDAFEQQAGARRAVDDAHDYRHHPSSRFATWSAATAAPTPSTASACACSPAAATASSAATAPARRRRSSAC